MNPAEPNKSAPPREPAARPSLFSDSAPAQEAQEEQSVSILSSLGPGAKSGQGKSQALFAGIATVALVVGATLWFMPAGQHASDIVAANPEVKFAAAPPVAAPVPEPTVVAAPSVPPMAPEPAQIETIKSPEPVSKDAKSTDGLAGLLPTVDATKDGVKKASSNAPTQPSVAIKEPKTKIAKSKAPEYIVHANSTPTRSIKVAAASTSKPAPSHSVTPAKKADAARDSDVALLEALVAYSEKAEPKFATREPSPKRAVAPFNPRRDVVMSRGALTTGELVSRCQSLGFLEGMLCRQRICSDLWGKDPACPGSTFSAN